jgi:flagellar biosynthetic protein FlhB
MAFKLERVAPFSGLRRVLASKDSWVQVGMALLKALVLGAAIWLFIAESLPHLGALSGMSLEPALVWTGGLVLRITLVALLASALLAAMDYLVARRRMHEQMKMTKQEIREEMKQQEGDPMVRARMRRRMRELGRNRMLADTRRADLVIVNPTHYSVALSYRVGQAGAPVLLAKGKDLMAAKIREIARQNQIPIVSNPPVARAVYAAGEVGREIPPRLYEMVARVLAWLYRMREGRAAA